jgi:hypothetical protein
VAYFSPVHGVISFSYFFSFLTSTLSADENEETIAGERVYSLFRLFDVVPFDKSIVDSRNVENVSPSLAYFPVKSSSKKSVQYSVFWARLIRMR